ncbi:hypothetical protein ACW9UR_13635 [Halovulum sp. GXIMD14794]
MSDVRKSKEAGSETMKRVFKYLAYLVALGAIVLVAYAQLAPPPAPVERVVVPVSPPAE